MGGGCDRPLGILGKRSKRLFEGEKIGVPAVGVDRGEGFLHCCTSDRIRHRAVLCDIRLKRVKTTATAQVGLLPLVLVLQPGLGYGNYSCKKVSPCCKILGIPVRCDAIGLPFSSVPAS